MGWCRVIAAAACLGILQLNSCQSRAHNTPVARIQRNVIESDAIVPYPYLQDSYRHRRDVNEDSQTKVTRRYVGPTVTFKIPLLGPRHTIVVDNTKSNANSDKTKESPEKTTPETDDPVSTTDISATKAKDPDNSEPASTDVPSTEVTGTTTEGSPSEMSSPNAYTDTISTVVDVATTTESAADSRIVDGVAVAEATAVTREIITITETETFTGTAAELSGDDTSETIGSGSPEGTPASGITIENNADAKEALVTDTVVRTTQIDTIIVSDASAQGTDTATAEADTSSTATPEDLSNTSVTSSASGDDVITDSSTYTDTITTVAETETISAAESQAKDTDVAADDTVPLDTNASDAYAEPSNADDSSSTAVSTETGAYSSADGEGNSGSLVQSYTTEPTKGADESITGVMTPEISTATEPTSDTGTLAAGDSPPAYETSNTDGSTSAASPIESVPIKKPTVITESEAYSSADGEGNSESFTQSYVSEQGADVSDTVATIPETSIITEPTSDTATLTTGDSLPAYETSKTDDSASTASPIESASINQPTVITESEAYSSADGEGNSESFTQSYVSEQGADESGTVATIPETSIITEPTSDTATPTTGDSLSAYETSKTDDSASTASPIEAASINQPTVITESEAYFSADGEGNSESFAQSYVSEQGGDDSGTVGTISETSIITEPTSDTDTTAAGDSLKAYETINTEDSTSAASPIESVSNNKPTVITGSESYYSANGDGNIESFSQSYVNEPTEGTENPQPDETIKVGVEEESPPKIDTKSE